MRRFSADYLATTRREMWTGDRDALEPLEISERDRILDVGCGTGAFTAVLASEATPETMVVGVDADRSLLDHIDAEIPVAGDACRLPFADDSFDLVVCQTLLINLPDPDVAVEEFKRVARETVAVIEPDNSAVTVSSTVETEPSLARRMRQAYIDGIDSDVTLGSDAVELFADAGFDAIDTRRHDHVKRIEPPYSEADLTVAREKATGSALDDVQSTLLAGDMSVDEFERFREEWRTMGRSVAEGMQDRTYRRVETVPFFVTIGRVPIDDGRE
ncbi:MAG: class I SAM-dependent methyltransferase [Halobacteriales archaeon]